MGRLVLPLSDEEELLSNVARDLDEGTSEIQRVVIAREMLHDA